jgi:hypothetical protein
MTMTTFLFDYLPTEKILQAYANAPGNEVESEKFSNPESSAALAANAFGLFLDRPQDLPAIPGTDEHGWPATDVTIECCVRFPWSGGMHPWLDVFIETPKSIIDVESKRYEPFRGKTTGSFSEAYWRSVWGDRMGSFERMRDKIAAGQAKFERLDATQLVKHAFGLRTEAQRRKKPATLIYLYAEPQAWPDGRPIKSNAFEVHASETRTFASEVAESEVAFGTCTYAALLAAFRASPLLDVRKHAANIEASFNPGRGDGASQS